MALLTGITNSHDLEGRIDSWLCLHIIWVHFLVVITLSASPPFLFGLSHMAPQQIHLPYDDVDFRMSLTTPNVLVHHGAWVPEDLVLWKLSVLHCNIYLLDVAAISAAV